VKRVLAATLALSAAACASGPWAARRDAAGPGFRGRLFAPRVFAPLLPGSSYPDRRRPIPARARPGVLVVVPPRLFGRASPRLADRGLVALRLEDARALPAAASWLSAQPECAGARIGVLLAGPAPGSWPERVAAFALVGASPAPAAAPRHVLWLSTAADGAPRGASIRLFKAAEGAAAGDVPKEAWRDAAEWLAHELEAPPP